MREIKFRAWDRKKNKLFPVHELEFHKSSHSLTKCVGYDDWDKDGYTMHGGGIMKYANEERYILMQYTGLKDKNGKEIYEGDIVDYRTYSRCNEPRTGLVHWDNANGGYKIRRKGHEPMMRFHAFDAWVASESEVIGNIYEHAHLLPQAIESTAQAQAE